MSPDAKKYESLRRSSVEEWGSETLGTPDFPSTWRTLSLKNPTWAWAALLAVFTIPLVANVFLLIRGYPRSALGEGDCPSYHGRHASL